MALLIPRQSIGYNPPSLNRSTWNKCMSKTACKWPVIIGIILVTGIILSLLICLIRCMCCGLDCCCGCLSCCRSRRPKRSKYADNFPPAPYHGYQPTPNPAYNPGGAAPSAQFASFDVSKQHGGKVNEDSLPAMPSWDNAKERKVYEEEVGQGHGDHGVELGRLDPQKAQKEPMLGNNGGFHGGHAESGYRDTEPGHAKANLGQYENPPYHHDQHPQDRLSPPSHYQQNPMDYNNTPDPGPVSHSPTSPYGSAPPSHQMPTSPPDPHYDAPETFAQTAPPSNHYDQQQQYPYHPQPQQLQQSISPPPQQPAVNQPSAYASYAPSSVTTSTRYEPTEVSSPVAAYPGMPAFGQVQQQQGAPLGALQPGRRPGQGAWTDI